MLDFKGSWEKHLLLVQFSYNDSYHATIGMTPYEVLYEEKYRSPIHCDEIGERKLVGSEILQQTKKIIATIKQTIKVSRTNKKVMPNNRREKLEFEKGNKACLKVAPIKKVMRFKKKRKLSLRFIGALEILERARNLAYRLTLPLEMASVHNVFYVSMLKKYVFSLLHVLSYEPPEIRKYLTNEEKHENVIEQKNSRTLHKENTFSEYLVEESYSWRSVIEANRKDEVKVPQLF